MYKLLGLCLTFSTLLALTTLASFASTCFWRLFGRLFDRFSAAARAGLLFGLRFLPIATAFVLVALFLVPSYVIDEPRNSGETVTVKFAIASLISIAGIVIAVWRGARAWTLTRRLIGE